MRALTMIVALAIGACAPTLSLAEGAPAPGEVGVHVQKAAGDGVHFAQGQGIYLGGGLVLTAAHVVNWDPDHPAVTIRLDGALAHGEIVFDSLQKETDLALVALAPDELSPRRRGQAKVPVCPDNAPPRQPVTVVEESDVSTSITNGIDASTFGGPGTNILTTAYHQGSSGGGVFDPRRGCLWGIILQEAAGDVPGMGHVDVTVFAPVTKIAPFVNGFLERQPPIDGAAR